VKDEKKGHFCVGSNEVFKQWHRYVDESLECNKEKLMENNDVGMRIDSGQ
jgi:hypothetical protein